MVTFCPNKIVSVKCDPRNQHEVWKTDHDLYEKFHKKTLRFVLRNLTGSS